MVHSLSSSPLVKIIDFGTCKYGPGPFSGRTVFNPLWLAPEVIAGQSYYLPADIYSFGVVCWELLTRQNVFGDLEFVVDIDDFVTRGGRPAFPQGSPEEFSELIQKCWNQVPEDRPTWLWILESLKSQKKSISELETQFCAQIQEKRLNEDEEKTKKREQEIKAAEEARRAYEEKVKMKKVTMY